MKTFYQILIIIFVLISLFILKEDIRQVIDNNFLSDKSEGNEILPTEFTSKKEEPLKLKMDTPGPLRVVDKFLSINENVVLSRDNIINITNKYREENGSLNSLKMDNNLNESAREKMEDMFQNQYFEHNSPDGVGVGDLGEQVGYDYILIGENLAIGNFNNDLALVDAWMNSPGHRANILNKNYVDIGVAVGQGFFNGKKIWMAVSHFGTPQNVCPGIDKVLLGNINLNQSLILEMMNELSLRRENIDKGAFYEGSTINEQIDLYNQLVNSYNDLILSTREKTEIYNNQVKTFNTCILLYQ